MNEVTKKLLDASESLAPVTGEKILADIKWASDFLTDNDAKSLLKDECRAVTEYHASLLAKNTELRTALENLVNAPASSRARFRIKARTVLGLPNHL